MQKKLLLYIFAVSRDGKVKKYSWQDLRKIQKYPPRPEGDFGNLATQKIRQINRHSNILENVGMS